MKNFLLEIKFRKLVVVIGFLTISTLFSNCDSSDSGDTSTSNSQNPPSEGEQNPPDVPSNELPTADVSPGTPGVGQARDISSFELVSELGPGWNLGNSFDVVNKDKTAWGNPLPSKAIIDQVANRGFKLLRVPVTWEWDQDDNAPFTIELDYLKRIQKVVDYGFQNKMHVIIDLHHDNEWAKPLPSFEANANRRMKSLWTQVATYFEQYNDSLIFEVMNEPRIKNIPQEWTGGTASGQTIINGYLKTGVDAIRATGGNNSLRHLMIPTWAASTHPDAMNRLVIPNNDPKAIVSLHTYFPFNFTLDESSNASNTWGSDQEKNSLINEFNRIRQKWIVENNRPIILGEWGVRTERPVNERTNYAAFYVKEASERGLPTILWDDGGGIGVLNRRTLNWNTDEFIDAIINNTSSISF